MTRVTPHYGNQSTPSVTFKSKRILIWVAVTLLCAFIVKSTEIVQWGDSSREGQYPGLTNAPIDLTNAVALSAGFYHNLALTSDGRVVAWGNNNSGQTNVPTDLSNVVAFAAGAFHNLAVTSDGHVRGWGDNTYGQANAPSGLSNIVQVSAGEYHSVALQADGRVVAWGNFFNGVTNDPAVVPASLSNCVTIASGASHALGVTANGRVIVWGLSSRTNTPPGLSNVVAITAGRDASIALALNGQLTVWPANSSPLTNIASMLTNVVSISMERLWSIALLANGTIEAWGGVTPGLDYGQTNPPTGLSDVVMVAAGRYHGLALVNHANSATSWSLPVSTITTNGAALHLPTQRGRLYVVEYSPSLNPDSWTVQQRMAGDGAVHQLSFPNASQGFHRVRRVP